MMSFMKRKRMVLMLTAWLFILGSPIVSAAEEGLVLHYDFDEASLATTVRDLTGNGNDGKIVRADFVPRGDGYAVRFNGPSRYVNCGNLNVQAKKALTLAFWLYLQDVPAVGASILAKDKAYSCAPSRHGWLDTRWNGSPKKCMVETGCLYPTGVWRHIALVFDGTSIRSYDNGRYLPGRQADYTGAFVTTPVNLRELAPGGALHIGWKSNSAKEDLPLLMMDDFRVYTRALSQDEVYRLYRKTAVPQIQVKPYVYRFADDVVLRLDAGALIPLPSGAKAEIAIRKKGSLWRSVIRKSAVLPRDAAITEVRVPMRKMSPGDYEVTVHVVGANGQVIGKKSVTPLVWPEVPSWPEAKGLKVLNAVVTELLNLQSPRSIKPTYRFVNPRNGWVFFATTTDSSGKGRLQVTLDPHPSGRPTKPLIIDHAGGIQTMEAMRLLPKGEYMLKMGVEAGFALDGLVVRAIPEMELDVPVSPFVKEYPAYDWEFIKKYLTPINYGMRGRRAWREQGKVRFGGARAVDHPKTIEKGASDYAAKLDNPNVDGIYIDEIGYPTHHPLTGPALWLLASQRSDLFAPDAPLRKSVNLYTYGKAQMFQNTPVARNLLKALIACNGHFSEEHYMCSQPDEATARASLDTVVTSWMVGARRSYSEAPAMSAALFAGWIHPAAHGVDMHADVDYHAFMEMQVRTIALQDTFFGLRGVGLYRAYYVDEEMIRWWGRLLRHYCIEGRTDRLWHGPYKMTHLRNPHFDKGTEGWSISAAEPGSIFMSGAEKCGQVILHWKQGSNIERLPGADVIVMRRSRTAPNTVSQEIKALTPGRLYSLRFTTADYSDLVKAKAEGLPLVDTPMKPALISASLDRVEVLPDKSFVHQAMRGRDSTGKSSHKKCGVNFHRIVFQAKSSTALLTFTDRSDKWQPGDTVGQENLLTWVKVQPYIED